MAGRTTRGAINNYGGAHCVDRVSCVKRTARRSDRHPRPSTLRASMLSLSVSLGRYFDTRLGRILRDCHLEVRTYRVILRGMARGTGMEEGIIDLARALMHKRFTFFTSFGFFVVVSILFSVSFFNVQMFLSRAA